MIPDLRHIPGVNGLPLIGNIPSLVFDNTAFVSALYAAHGPVSRARGVAGVQVVAVGPEAAGAVLGDRGEVWSAELGMGPFFAELFPETLMVLDGEAHRRHRAIMHGAFAPAALRRYLPRVDACLAAVLARWRGDLDVYRASRALTLALADEVFLGLGAHPDRRRIGRALVDMISATAAVIRRPLPFTRYRRGQKGRRVIEAALRPMIAARRRAADPGDDLLGLLVGARDEGGDRFTDDEVFNHTAFMWLAAHDTLTTAFSALCDHLAHAPRWQESLRAEVRAIPPDGATEAALSGQPLCDRALREALRLHPPVGVLPRRARRDTELLGHRIPRGAPVFVNIALTHRLPDVWPDPDRFDPDRFAPDAPPRPRFSWIPYGSGPHTCLGARHSAMVSRVFLRHLLTRVRLEPRAARRPRWTVVPINRPRGGVRLRLAPLDAGG